MPSVYVHYCVDPHGVTTLHFSGSDTRPNQRMTNQQNFSLAVSAINQIPSGKRRWDATDKLWMIDSEYWNKIKLFFEAGHQIFKMVPYTLSSTFDSFMADEAFNSIKNGTAYANKPDNVAAQSFFNNFNAVVEKVAVTKTDKEMLAELLAITSYDAIPRDKSAALKLYRQAALRLHPDRNNGDGSKMSSLTQLWREYVQPTL